MCDIGKMGRFYFRKLMYDNVGVIAMFEFGEIQKPIAILFPDDIEDLIKTSKNIGKEKSNE